MNPWRVAASAPDASSDSGAELAHKPVTSPRWRPNGPTTGTSLPLNRVARSLNAFKRRRASVNAPWTGVFLCRTGNTLRERPKGAIVAKLVADYVLQRLTKWGVHWIYGYPGDGINAFLGAFDRAQQRTVVIRPADRE